MLSDSISMHINGHGHFHMTAVSFDWGMSRHLPASVEELRAKLQERVEGTDIDYSDLQTVTECLMVLAEYEPAPF